MENEFLEHQKEQSLQINEQAKAYLMIACKWAKFLAIVGFVWIGLFCIMGAFAGSIFKNAMNSMSGMSTMPFDPSIIGIIYILLAALFFYPTVKLYRFAKVGLNAIKMNSLDLIEESLNNLKSFFKFHGVLVAFFIGLYLLLIIVAFLGGIVGGLM